MAAIVGPSVGTVYSRLIVLIDSHCPGFTVRLAWLQLQYYTVLLLGSVELEYYASIHAAVVQY